MFKTDFCFETAFYVSQVSLELARELEFLSLLSLLSKDQRLPRSTSWAVDFTVETEARVSGMLGELFTS